MVPFTQRHIPVSSVFRREEQMYRKVPVSELPPDSQERIARSGRAGARIMANIFEASRPVLRGQDMPTKKRRRAAERGKKDEAAP